MLCVWSGPPTLERADIATASRSQKHGSLSLHSAVLPLLRSPGLWTTVVRKTPCGHHFYL